MSAMQQELLALTAAVQNDKLRPPPPRGERHIPNVPSHTSSFGEQHSSRRRTEAAIAFGHCSREEDRKVFISKENSKSEPGNLSPGYVYNIKGTLGKQGSSAVGSGLKRGTCAVFGSDARDSALLREYKAQSIKLPLNASFSVTKDDAF